ncbi:hypothetical protein GCM10009665_65240 [Kitasatospora nipponensis]|uniref:SnoaL-like domain-containing protein n=1 Tax=Kitasatospora nipponensis TaxID=258049 RepID=A0ABP4HMV2_9ACTN
MSEENVTAVRRIYENFARGAVEEVLAGLQPDVEWIESEAEFMPQRGTHVGPGAVAEKVFGVLPVIFESFAATPLTVHDAGEVVVVEGRTSGVTRTGHALDAAAVWVLTLRDGRVARMVNYHDTDAWRRALVV